MSPSQNNWPFVINVGNSIIGVTILAMPFCFKTCGIVLGSLILFFATWMTMTSCDLLMKAGVTSRRKSFSQLAYYTYGATGKLIVEVGLIGLQLGTLVAQVVIIGDLGPAIVSKATGLENTDNLRTGLIVFLCLFVGLPLGLLKDLRTLSKTSTMCILFYTFFTVYVVLQSIPNLLAGTWYLKINFWRMEGFFQCLPIFSFAFGCQTQLFIVYDALAEPSLKRINSIVSSAVNMCTVAYLLVGFFGYIAFCNEEEITGDIINHFGENTVSDAIKLCFVFSIAVSIPLIVFPCRASLYTLLFPQKPKEDVPSSWKIPELHFRVITVCVVVGSMIIGILIPNIEFVLGLNGATMGTLICYIFPALFFLNVMADSITEGKLTGRVVLILGVIIMVASTYTTLTAQDHKEAHLAKASDLGPSDGVINVDVKNIEENNKEFKNEIDKDLQLEALNKGKSLDKTDTDNERHEPPVPQAPLDTPKDKGEEVKDNVNIEKKDPGDDNKVKDNKDTDTNKDTKDTQLDNVDKEVKEGLKDKVDLEAANDNENEDTKLKNKEETKEDEEKLKKKEEEEEKKKKEEQDKIDEVKKKEAEKKQDEILEKLEQQQEEQKKLIDEQKQILEQLKQHNQDHKDDVPAQPLGQANVANLQQGQPVVQQQVQPVVQQQGQAVVQQQGQVAQQQGQVIQQPGVNLQQGNVVDPLLNNGVLNQQGILNQQGQGLVNQQVQGQAIGNQILGVVNQQGQLLNQGQPNLNNLGQGIVNQQIQGQGLVQQAQIVPNQQNVVPGQPLQQVQGVVNQPVQGVMNQQAQAPLNQVEQIVNGFQPNLMQIVQGQGQAVNNQQPLNPNLGANQAANLNVIANQRPLLDQQILKNKELLNNHNVIPNVVEDKNINKNLVNEVKNDKIDVDVDQIKHRGKRNAETNEMEIEAYSNNKLEEHMNVQKNSKKIAEADADQNDKKAAVDDVKDVETKENDNDEENNEDKMVNNNPDDEDDNDEEVNENVDDNNDYQHLENTVNKKSDKIVNDINVKQDSEKKDETGEIQRDLKQVNSPVDKTDLDIVDVYKNINAVVDNVNRENEIPIESDMNIEKGPDKYLDNVDENLKELKDKINLGVQKPGFVLEMDNGIKSHRRR